LQRFHGQGFIVQPGEYHNGRLWRLGVYAGQGRQAAAIRQVEVQKNNVEGLFGQMCQGCGETIGACQLDPDRAGLGERLFQQQKIVGIILDQQDAHGVSGHWA